MKLRLLLLGFCSSLVLNSSALAGSAPALSIAPPVAEQTAVVNVAAKASAETPKKKTKTAAKSKKTKVVKKLTPEEEKKLAKEKAAQEKKAAKLKAEEDRKVAKAKAAEERKLAAEARAKAAEEKRVARAKAEEERKVAKAKAAEERKLAAEARAKAADEKRVARAKADEERKAANAKAAEDKRVAKAKAEEDKRLAKAKAEEDRRLAIVRAEETRQAAEKARRQAEIAQLTAMEIAKTGNNGELRSETIEPEKPKGLFAGLFGGPIVKQSMLPETRALDAALEQKEGGKKFKVKSDFEPQEVSYSGYEKGTIVIDTTARYLYLIESSRTARRYAIAVGREGLEFKGTGKIGDKQEWPRWIPTKEMQERDPQKYGQYKDGMPGGPDNPLGARAMYLYQGKKDTHIRIHGTNQPQTIGTNSSNGCFRMVNEHVMDLYGRVKMGTDVIVM